MYVVALFNYSPEMELALGELEQRGVSREAMAAVPLEPAEVPELHAMDTIRHSDGISLLDGPAVLGTVFSVLGASLGFRWHWGPLLWGLIGLMGGALLGFLADAFINRRWRRARRRVNSGGDVLLIVECTPQEEAKVRSLLHHYQALRVGRLGRGEGQGGDG